MRNMSSKKFLSLFLAVLLLVATLPAMPIVAETATTTVDAGDVATEAEAQFKIVVDETTTYYYSTLQKALDAVPANDWTYTITLVDSADTDDGTVTTTLNSISYTYNVKIVQSTTATNNTAYYTTKASSKVVLDLDGKTLYFTDGFSTATALVDISAGSTFQIKNGTLIDHSTMTSTSSYRAFSTATDGSKMIFGDDQDGTSFFFEAGSQVFYLRHENATVEFHEDVEITTANTANNIRLGCALNLYSVENYTETDTNVNNERGGTVIFYGGKYTYNNGMFHSATLPGTLIFHGGTFSAKKITDGLAYANNVSNHIGENSVYAGVSGYYYSILPAIFSIESVKYATLADAIDAVPNGGADIPATATTIKLLRDYATESSTTVNVGYFRLDTNAAKRNVILDLGGYTWTCNGKTSAQFSAYGQLTIQNGTIKDEGTSNNRTIVALGNDGDTDTAKIILKDLDITAQNILATGSRRGGFIELGEGLTVSCTKLVHLTNNWGVNYDNQGFKGINTVTVSGGVYKITGDTFAGSFTSLKPSDWDGTATSGTFTKTDNTTYANYVTMTVSITGGTFSIDPTDYLAVGYKATQNDEKYSVSSYTFWVSTEEDGVIGGYDTLSDAIDGSPKSADRTAEGNEAATAATATITMKGDYEEETKVAYTIGTNSGSGDLRVLKYHQDIILDMDSHTLTYCPSEGASSVFGVNAKLTIKNGTLIDETCTEYTFKLQCPATASLTLENVTVISKAPSGAIQNSGIYSNTALVINNSTITTEGYLAFIAGANSTATIDGGTYTFGKLGVGTEASVTVASGTFNRDPRKYSSTVTVSGDITLIPDIVGYQLNSTTDSDATAVRVLAGVHDLDKYGKIEFVVSSNGTSWSGETTTVFEKIQSTVGDITAASEGCSYFAILVIDDLGGADKTAPLDITVNFYDKATPAEISKTASVSYVIGDLIPAAAAE